MSWQAEIPDFPPLPLAKFGFSIYNDTMHIMGASVC